MSKKIKKKTDSVYNLVQTKKGLFPIEQIEEGTEVLSLGKWIKSPKPCLSEVIECRFDTLPTTYFQPDFLSHEQVALHHSFIYNEFQEHAIDLVVRAYFSTDRKTDWVSVSDVSSLQYWYPKWIKFFNRTKEPIISNNGFLRYYVTFPELHNLHDNELSERNLEYYLEGMLRKRFFFPKGNEKPQLSDFRYADETDKIVCRLLDINMHLVSNGTSVDSAFELFSHIKDKISKSMIPFYHYELAMRRKIDIPDYTLSEKIKSKETKQAWILPGINPDINGLNPLITNNMFYNDPLKKTATIPYDKYGRRNGSYNPDNMWAKLGLD